MYKNGKHLVYEVFASSFERAITDLSDKLDDELISEFREALSALLSSINSSSPRLIYFMEGFKDHFDSAL